MNNVIMRTIPVTTAFTPLSAERFVGTFEICTPPQNTGRVVFRVPDGGSVEWIPGETHFFQRINLRDIEIRGVAGDTVAIVGGTW